MLSMLALGDLNVAVITLMVLMLDGSGLSHVFITDMLACEFLTQDFGLNY